MGDRPWSGALDAFRRQAASLEETGHRPWEVPGRQWVLGQTWERLLFAHWRARPSELEQLIPAGLRLELFDGSGWLGITPFVLSGFRSVAMPPLPRVSTFAEVNVRTYVTAKEKPGILFFSLDAASRWAVEGARRFYRLPYYLADMEVDAVGEEVRYRSERRDQRGANASLLAAYGPDGAAAKPSPGTLEHFLTERYCLYATEADGTLLRAEIHHSPWELRPAAVEIERNTMAPNGVTLSGEPLFHLGERQDVLIWWPELV